MVDCFSSFRGNEKDLQVHNIYLDRIMKIDINVDLNLVAFTAPPLLDSGPKREEVKGTRNMDGSS